MEHSLNWTSSRTVSIGRSGSLTMGVKASGSLAVPLVANDEVEASTSVTACATSSSAETTTISRTLSVKPMVPPKSIVDVDLVIEHETWDVRFEAVVAVGGICGGDTICLRESFTGRCVLQQM